MLLSLVPDDETINKNKTISENGLAERKINIGVDVISIINDVSFEKLYSIPNCCGAYIITVESGKRYVGSSKTVRTRIQSHNTYNDPNIIEDIDKVSFYLTKSHMDARILEYWLIRESSPEYDVGKLKIMIDEVENIIGRKISADEWNNL